MVSTFGQGKRPKNHFAIGAGVSYNYSIETTGIHLRAEIPVMGFVSLVGHAEHYPNSSKIAESNFTGQLNVIFYSQPKLSLYLSSGYNYNTWHNYANYENNLAQLNSHTFELGTGLDYRFLPFSAFFEYRYNLIWGEPKSTLGLKYNLFSKRINKGKHYPCPAF
jgi:squalene cyclase